MPKKYRKTKKSFVNESDDPLIDPDESTSRKFPCYCDICKGTLIDWRTKKKHNLKRNFGPRRIIEDIDPNQDLTNDSSSESVNLFNNPNSMEVDLTSDNDDRMIIETNQTIPQEENYTFFTKKVLKDKPKRKQKDIGSSSGIKYPIVVIEQNISDGDDDGDDDGNDDDEND
jgi:hypothetical protein